MRGIASAKLPRGLIDRRAFLVAVVGGFLAAPLATGAQQSRRAKRISVLTGLSEKDVAARNGIERLREGLRLLGWREGDNLEVTYRFAGGDPERSRTFAREVVGLKPDLIVAHTAPVTAALHQATRTRPIVFVSIPDPVALGLVTSITRPGGNMTGFTNYDFAMGAKWLEILKEIAPRTTRVVVLLNPDTESYYSGYWQSIEAGTRASSVAASLSPVRSLEEIEHVIAALGDQPGVGLIVLPSAPIVANLRHLLAAVARYRVPAIYPFGSYAKQGGLVAYGASLGDLFRRAASYVDRILNGEKPADLPVQAPTKFELVINLKTAKALGLTIPQSLLLRADEIFE